jgi:hypothetical protein
MTPPADRAAESVQPAGGRRPLRQAAMWLMLGAMLLLAALGLMLAFYATVKLTYSAYTCGSFARIDGEIGWVLKPSTTSCLGGRSAFSPSRPWFHSTVFTDVNGFRAARPGGRRRPAA